MDKCEKSVDGTRGSGQRPVSLRTCRLLREEKRQPTNTQHRTCLRICTWPSTSFDVSFPPCWRLDFRTAQKLSIPAGPSLARADACDPPWNVSSSMPVGLLFGWVTVVVGLFVACLLAVSPETVSRVFGAPRASPGSASSLACAPGRRCPCRPSWGRSCPDSVRALFLTKVGF